jgi:hypothetical protein
MKLSFISNVASYEMGPQSVFETRKRLRKASPERHKLHNAAVRIQNFSIEEWTLYERQKVGGNSNAPSQKGGLTVRNTDNVRPNVRRGNLESGDALAAGEGLQTIKWRRGAEISWLKLVIPVAHWNSINPVEALQTF